MLSRAQEWSASAPSLAHTQKQSKQQLTLAYMNFTDCGTTNTSNIIMMKAWAQLSRLVAMLT